MHLLFEHTQCPQCKTGKLELTGTYINVAKEGVCLVNAATLRNCGSPIKIPKPVL